MPLTFEKYQNTHIPLQICTNMYKYTQQVIIPNNMETKAIKHH